MRRTPFALLVPLVVLSCRSGAPAAVQPAPEPVVAASATPPAALLSRPERTQFRETSSHADVLAFLDSLRVRGGAFAVETLAVSTEGRPIPMIVASRPLVRTPDEARRLGRPVVLVQGNIHGGEVEGKEALQVVLRDLLLDARPNVLDSIVLLAVPNYNPDGNEQLGPQETNRAEQNGPASVGRRANGQGLDLNRDYVKAEAPETRGALAAFARWDPHLFVDLHTTNGSYHGYALTYSPSLNPAAALRELAFGGAWARANLLPELRRRMRSRHALETFDYGNFSLRYGDDVNTDTTRRAWYSYDHRPRFGTNYYGLRGRVAVLGEAYSHDPFERRVRTMHAFVREILSLAAERGDALVTLARSTDARVAAPASRGLQVPLRGTLVQRARTDTVIMEDLARADSGVVTEPGVPAGLRRTGSFRRLVIPVHDRFDPRRPRPLPAGWALAARDTAAVRLLQLHGVRVERVGAARPVEAERFTPDSVIVAEREFQGHREVRLEGRWRPAALVLAPGSWFVPAQQPLGVLAAWLLEPESEDGLVTWNVLSAASLPVRVMR
jgi:hypothetical protein